MKMEHNTEVELNARVGIGLVRAMLSRGQHYTLVSNQICRM